MFPVALKMKLFSENFALLILQKKINNWLFSSAMGTAMSNQGVPQHTSSDPLMLEQNAQNTARVTANYQNQITELNQANMNDSLLMDNNDSFGYMNDESFTGNNNSANMDNQTDPDFIKVIYSSAFQYDKIARLHETFRAILSIR